MKKILLIVTLFASAFLQISFGQDSAAQTESQLPRLLSSYYGVKDALVAGNSTKAAASAQAPEATGEAPVREPTR